MKSSASEPGLKGCLYGGRKILEGGLSLLTSTIQGHEKTSIEQDKLKIPPPPPPQFYYKVRQPFLSSEIATLLQN